MPGKVLSVDGMVATCDFWGVKKEIRLDVIDEPVVAGDYLLNHVGYAIRRIPPEDIGETLAMYDELLGDVRGDLMAADVRGELDAAPSARTAETRDE